MARIQYWQFIIDRNGRPLQDAQVRIYLAGTGIEATIFTHPEFGTFTTSSQADLKTNDNGYFEVWFGDQWEVAGGYEAQQKFKVQWSGKDIVETIENLTPFSPLLPVDTTDSGLTASGLNKLISNRQGKKWDDHVDSVVPSAAPHDLAPVNLFSRNTVQRKVISNKLGYSMYEMAYTSLLVPIDVSAAGYHEETFGSWSPSGEFYYNDVTHSLNNEYPTVRVFKTSDDRESIPEKVKPMTPDVVRIWIGENISTRVLILG